MEAIWESSEKGSDDSLHYPLELLHFLYQSGFIDTHRHSLEEWVQACETFKKNDGDYQFTKAEFLSLEPYRYAGEIKTPFDPMRINEGKYTNEGFQKLIDNSLKPSCSLAATSIDQRLEELKNKFRQPDHLILVGGDFKLAIRRLLEEYPSPLRRLEHLFDAIVKSPTAQKEIAEKQATMRRTATPHQHANIQKSLFIQGTQSIGAIQAQKLRALQQTKSTTSKTDSPQGDPLKTLKRSPKGFRG